MGKGPSEKKAMKATVEDEIIVGQPPPVRAPETQETQQPRGSPAQQQTGESSNSSLQSAGPGFNSRVANTPDGLRVNGINPSFGQPSSIHQMPAPNNYIHPNNYVHPHLGPTSASSPFVFNHPLASFSTNPLSFHYYNYNNNNLGVSGQPIFFHPHQLSSVVRLFPFTPTVATMAADYGTTSFPPGAQHFQPPVPDTTYGPIPHVYHPRFDHHDRFASVSRGVATAPYAVSGGMGYPSQHTIVQHGHAVQPIGGGAGQPFFANGAPGPSGQPILAQPAMMPGGMPAGGPGMAVPIGGQGPVLLGSGTPGCVHPDMLGVGRTPSEHYAETLQAGHDQGAMEPQDFKPADDDPSRMYFCRELDGTWILRNRYTLDNLPIRWYVTTHGPNIGVFYAIRLED